MQELKNVNKYSQNIGQAYQILKLQNSPSTVCGAQRTPCRPTVGTPGTAQCYAIWCAAENTAWADRAFLVKPSDVFFQGLPQRPTDRHQVII